MCVGATTYVWDILEQSPQKNWGTHTAAPPASRQGSVALMHTRTAGPLPTVLCYQTVVVVGELRGTGRETGVCCYAGNQRGPLDMCTRQHICGMKGWRRWQRTQWPKWYAHKTDGDLLQDLKPQAPHSLTHADGPSCWRPQEQHPHTHCCQRSGPSRAMPTQPHADAARAHIPSCKRRP